MAHRVHRSFTVLTVVLAAAVLGLLAAAPSAQARVSIVPGAVPGGGTEVFAFRLANERPGTASTRLELTFPQVPPITFAEVAGVRGWTATIQPRDNAGTQVVGSIVIEGGRVGSGQFEQFLIKLGPLPESGTLTFVAKQGYDNGDVDTFAGATAPGIKIGSGNVVGAPPVGGPANPGPGGGTEPAEPAAAGGVSTSGLLWVALGLAVAFIVLVGIRTRLLATRDETPVTEAVAVRKEDDTEQEAVSR